MTRCIPSNPTSTSTLTLTASSTATPGNSCRYPRDGGELPLRFDYRPNVSLPALLRALRRNRLLSGLTPGYADLYQVNSPASSHTKTLVSPGMDLRGDRVHLLND